MTRLKTMTVLGTRPEIIRLSRVMARLDQATDHVLVHTGQNWDFELNELFFQELGVRKPDHFLGVDPSSLGTVLGNILISIEPLLKEHRPDAFVVLGDTNSSIAAMIAKRLRVPIYHMEAGNRCFDANVPEEINRRVIDHLSDFNLTYTEHARRNLLGEGLHPRRIYVTGSPMREVLGHYREAIEASPILEEQGLEKGKYFVVSIHREENVDAPSNLKELVATLEALWSEYGYPVIVSTHPRTRQRLEALGQLEVQGDIRFAKPFGFFAYNKLQLHSHCAVSDSGTISEESSILGFPAVTVRKSIERPEAMDTGAITLAGLQADAVLECIREVARQWAAGEVPEVPQDYRIENTSQRVLNLILGTARLHGDWSGFNDRAFER
ncbi:MAG: UDP-N-acetylglucosamine 2-epimerase (non-hydrolyzing) [Planctomycetes bacterium]|nr:UDP-N-acetylglucosamine 2-epimerase (non-hydrolyzing) [Planctomycetota bacterium]